MLFASSLNFVVVLKFVQEVMSIPCCKSAIEAKMSALSQNVTWSLVARPLGKLLLIVVGCIL